MKKQRQQHRLSSHKLYSVWCNIVSRCYNTKNPRYKDYGGRGIAMCDEWRNDFKKFYDWAISNGWAYGLEVDKDINGSGLYSPDNCLIVTPAKNINNTRTNKYITYKGQTKSVAEWCSELQINPFLVYKRLRRGWSAEDSLETKKVHNSISKTWRSIFSPRISISYSFGYIN